jgi:hypothetical protein
MKWIFPVVAVALAIPLGVLNVFWLLAIVFVIMWAAQRFA